MTLELTEQQAADLAAVIENSYSEGLGPDVNDILIQLIVAFPSLIGYKHWLTATEQRNVENYYD